MAFAGGLGATIDLDGLALEDDSLSPVVRLFSESNSRLLCEVSPEHALQFEAVLDKIPHAKIGSVNDSDRLTVVAEHSVVIDCKLATLKEAWQAPLRW